MDEKDIPLLESIVDEYVKWISEELEEVVCYDETKLQILQKAVSEFASTIKPILASMPKYDSNESSDVAVKAGVQLHKIYNDLLPLLKPHLTLMNFPQLAHRNGIIVLLSKVVGISLNAAYTKLAEIVQKHEKLKPLSKLLIKQ